MANEKQMKNAALIGIGATAIAAAGALAYYYYNYPEGSPIAGVLDLLFPSMHSEANPKTNVVVCKDKPRNPADMTEEEVVSVLKKILGIQQQTKDFLKKLVTSLSTDPKPLKEVYELVKADTPADPLASDGISMSDFDLLLNKYENRPEVKNLIDAIMGNENFDELTPRARNLGVEQIIDIHKFMNSELRTIVNEAKQVASSGTLQYESRYLTMAGQALVGAKVLKQFGVDPQEVEASMMLNYMSLQYEHEFLKVSVQMQAAMGELMGVNES